MLEFCARHSIEAVTEHFPMSEVNEAVAHLAAGKARYRVNLALLRAENGRPEVARELLLALIADYPRYVNGWYNLAYLEYLAGNMEEARRALEWAAGLGGVTAQQREQIDQLRAMLGQPEG